MSNPKERAAGLSLPIGGDSHDGRLVAHERTNRTLGCSHVKHVIYIVHSIHIIHYHVETEKNWVYSIRILFFKEGYMLFSDYSVAKKPCVNRYSIIYYARLTPIAKSVDANSGVNCKKRHNSACELAQLRAN